MWDVAGVAMRENAQSQNGITVWRKSQPPTSLPESYQSDWNKLKAHDHRAAIQGSSAVLRPLQR